MAVFQDAWQRIRPVLGRVDEQWRGLVALFVVGAGAWVIELADEVGEGTTDSLDRRLLLALRVPGDVDDPIGPGWLEEMMRDFTALGGVGVLTLVTLAAIGYALLARRWQLAVAGAVAVGGGLLMSSALKALIDRARPDVVPHGSEVATASFPSGHSMMAATVYFTLAAVLMRFGGHRGTRVYVLGVASLLTLLVGISRVYLGVHWPTDVVAGWTVGACWALLVSIISAWLQERGRLP